MKIAIVSTAPGSAVDLVLKDVLKYLPNVEADFYYPFDVANKEFDEYDLVHWGWVGQAQWHGVGPPTTGNLWGIYYNHWDWWRTRIKGGGWSRIIVDDDGTVQALGQLEFLDLKQIPLTRDFSKFPLLTPPTGPFTVACFGNEYASKRFDVVVEACKLAGVRCWAMTLPAKRQVTYLVDAVADVYAQCHMYAHAAFKDTNSLPAMEALSCGRPVAAVVSSGLRRILLPGCNGEFFDGSAEDLAAKITTIKDNYEWYREGARVTLLPSIKQAASQYEEVWLDAIQRSK